MAPIIRPVQTSSDLPRQTTVVILGGGIIGLTAGLTLAERGIPVTILEKGRIGAEQSSRNLGWVRKLNRDPEDVALSVASDTLWTQMPQRTGFDVGYRRAGIMYAARSEAEMEPHRKWLQAVSDLSLDSRLVTPREIDDLLPGTAEKWVGGIHTPSDGYAEPTLASSAIATAAQQKGAVIIENCAAFSLSLAGGRVAGVHTERGEIKCDQVLLAAGLWSRRFLGNMGISLPTLPMVASVIRTAPMDGPSDIAFGASDFSFRKRLDGGYTVTQRGALCHPLTIDNLLIGLKYLPTLRNNWKYLRLSLGREFLGDLGLPRRWKDTGPSPFERVRTKDPLVDAGLIAEAIANTVKAFPVFEKAEMREAWAGMIDVTPDSLPVISGLDRVPGLTLATGFSGHGFGTSPAAGQLAADLVSGMTPIVDPAPYRFSRLSK
ncbi:NAD(P)/FAD-dependent oxidoreductase [Martelella soudanensis]|uniref:NAD(P)/FAD-dependent oxidoreductase n=1 Tax=unclassified Martelella TaxID=2629616 RepID=UPI0015DF74F4|nr:MULTISPECIES: FAD-binding oxidoreductase [unclassified Martelella]